LLGANLRPALSRETPVSSAALQNSVRLTAARSVLVNGWEYLDDRIKRVTDEIERLARVDVSCRQLMTVQAHRVDHRKRNGAAIGNGTAVTKGSQPLPHGMLFIQGARAVLLHQGAWAKHRPRVPARWHSIETAGNLLMCAAISLLFYSDTRFHAISSAERAHFLESFNSQMTHPNKFPATSGFHRGCGISSALFPALTACPICDARWLYNVRLSLAPIVIMRSCVRVRPVEKNVPVVFAETCINFQVGVTFPLDTMMNLTSYEIVSGF
jgi:hypothetical protein